MGAALVCVRPCTPAACGSWQRHPRLAQPHDDTINGSSKPSYGRCTKSGNPVSCHPSCIQLEGKVTRTTWQYVGPGRGTHEQSQSYDYVGNGCGDHQPVERNVQHGWRLGRYCILLLILASVAVVCWGFYLNWLQQLRSPQAHGGHTVALTQQAHPNMRLQPPFSVKTLGSPLTKVVRLTWQQSMRLYRGRPQS
mmetsp:Transcript_79367/g.157255  ORF Transcript_79367/g.157255 Transcript_79367/m.157255 type:complete len:194 (-) Transcript_79367:385-966(-)